MSIVVRAGRPADIATVGDLWEQMLAYHIERDRRYLTADGAREAFLHYVRVRVLRVPARGAHEAMAAGEVDIAIGLFPDLKAGFFQQRLYRDEFVCIVRTGHPATRMRSLPRPT